MPKRMNPEIVVPAHRVLMFLAVACGILTLCFPTPLSAENEPPPHLRAADLVRENPPRHAEALELLKEAFDAGDLRGQELLAYLYTEGPAETRDLKKAAGIYQHAAEAGSQPARHNLALLRLEGSGVRRDTTSAIALLEVNASEDYLPSTLKIAEIHYFGCEDIPRDFTKAIPHLKAAAEQQSAWAENLLGVVHQYGQGTPPCRDTAISWYRRAADRGHVRAMSNLGHLLRSGPPQSHDVPGAIMWLTLAAEAGDAAARNTLEDVGNHFDPQDREKARRRLETYRRDQERSADSQPAR